MNSKLILTAIAIVSAVGMITGPSLLDSAFAAKGGQPGCGVDSKGAINSLGKCLKEPKCVDTDEVLCDGGDPGDSDGSD